MTEKEEILMCYCHVCGWNGEVKQAEEYTFNDDRYSEFYCPKCDGKIIDMATETK